MDPMAWNIVVLLLPPFNWHFLAIKLAKDIRYPSFCWVRLGWSLIGIGWLGYSLLTFLTLINVVVPLAAWAWTTHLSDASASVGAPFKQSTPTRAPWRWRASRLFRRTPPARSETVDRPGPASVCHEAVGSSPAYSRSRRNSFPAE